ncbi:MAG TPA: hypothetical protein VEZ40_04655 [Pyrinomonadaceae bacterium]|nr:hypothetical protein [Pyrinomonadaceae bacterium]
MSHSIDEKQTAQAQADVQPGWPPTDDLPNDPTVILVFHGLMGFAYNPLGFCEVGMHAKAPEHEFSVHAYGSTTPSDDDLLYSYKAGPAGDMAINVIRFDVKNPRTEGVQFYKPGVTSIANQQEASDDRAFSAVLDLEGPDFYNRPLRKKPGAFKPRMHVKNGIFYTYARTPKQFRRSAPNDDLNLGRIAWLIGANIYLQDDGFVSLRIGSEELRLKAAGGRKYLLFFNNGCPHGDCTYIPTSAKKEKRNDFYLYYKTFDIPNDREEYELVLNDSRLTPRAIDSAPKSVANLRSILGPLADKLSNDEAPCGGAGYGKGGGLDV